MANLSNLLAGQSNIVTDQDLATVATTGSYTDLVNKPVIPTGGATAFLEYSQVISTDYTITAGKNALAIGPVTINAGVSVNVNTDQNWLVLNEGQL